jgi:hypothetical protein
LPGACRSAKAAAMSLNGGTTNKQRQREELEKLVAEYDGPITRDRGSRVQVACSICSARRMVGVDQLQFKLHCLRCGAAVKAT